MFFTGFAVVDFWSWIFGRGFFAVLLVDFLRGGFLADFEVDFKVDFEVDFEVDLEVDFEVDFEADFVVDFRGGFFTIRFVTKKNSPRNPR